MQFVVEKNIRLIRCSESQQGCQLRGLACAGLRANRRGDGGEDGDDDVIYLLNASLTYAATRNLSLWARGENLLAQKYEINLNYPMPRATFMAGVDVSF